MTGPREFQALFMAALDAVLVIDDARTIVDANPAAGRLFASSIESLVGRRFDELLHGGGDVSSAWQIFLATGQQTGELPVVRTDGLIRTVEYSATARFAPGQHLAILRDISDRTRVEAERAALLRQEERRLRESETLLAVSRALSATNDPTETMRRVAREIAQALHADTVGAYLADVAQVFLQPVAGYRVPREMLDTFRRYPIPIKNHPAIEEAWATRRAVSSNDMPADPRVDPETLRRFPHQSDLFVPICIKDRPVGGFFVIWWTEQRSFTDDQVRLLHGISDLAGVFLENAQLYRDAADANRAKDEFLAVLSHELRNPLGAINNAVAALERRAEGDQTSARLRQIVHRQTRHLARLVDDLLDVARVTAGKVSLRPHPVDLSEVVARCVRALMDSGRSRNHRIGFRAQAVTVNADRTRLEQIVTNLVDNALKYTPPGGSVDIEVAQEGDDAVFRVTDTGMGIPSQMLPRVFELFAQAEQPMDRALGGLGIGLTLARRLVELHGGRISAFSEGPGRGAQFVVRLPVDSGGPILTPAPAPASAAPRRVLIIEDNDDVRESLRLLLESLGHQVAEASDGTRGLALALEAEPEVVLIDLGLPGLDGYDVARALRSSPAGKRTTLIAVTGYGQADDIRRSTDAGFDVHLVKPVSESVLSNLIAVERSG